MTVDLATLREGDEIAPAEVVVVRAAHRRPDLQGKPVTVVGTVARLYDEGGKCRAALELQIINQGGPAFGPRVLNRRVLALNPGHHTPRPALP